VGIFFKELVRRPGRFVPVGGALTMLVVLLVVLGGFLDGLELNQTGPYRAHEGRLLVFSDQSDLLIGRSRVDVKQADVLAKADGVAKVGVLNQIASTAQDVDGDVVDIVLFGYDLPTDVLPAPPSDGAVIDAALADRNDVKVGDTLLIGPTSEPVEVSNVVDDLSQGSPTVWLSSKRWREIVQKANPAAVLPTGVDQALVVQPSDTALDTAGLDALAGRLGGEDGIDVVTPEQAMQALPVVQQQSSTFRGHHRRHLCGHAHGGGAVLYADHVGTGWSVRGTEGAWRQNARPAGRHFGSGGVRQCGGVGAWRCAERRLCQLASRHPAGSVGARPAGPDRRWRAVERPAGKPVHAAPSSSYRPCRSDWIVRMPALELDKARKVYGADEAQVVALDDVTLTVAEDEMMLLVGPSGSGKTTLLTVAGALLRPTSGSVRVGGTEITDLNDKDLANFRRDQVGFVFQSVNLVPFLTARENLLVVRQFGGARIDSEAKDRADELLDELGLGQRGDSLPSQLSGGQQQRVAIGRALMNDPSLVLVDEPTSSLDSELGKQVMDLLEREIKGRGVAAIIVTHDERVLDYGDRTVRIVDGALQAD
jgi:putative ABC transport system ATP-binding protein